jgi:hypothetical protein
LIRDNGDTDDAIYLFLKNDVKLNQCRLDEEEKREFFGERVK